MASQDKTPSDLLQPLETAVVAPTPAPFSVKGYFEQNSSVRFSNVFSEFKNRFFGKTEIPAGEVTYRKYKLLKICADGPIIAALGGESQVAGTVAAVCGLLQRQPNGQPGFLQTTGYANIFYVKDGKGVLCAIRVGWTDGGWIIDAISVQDPLAWNGKHDIFCPDSKP